MSPCKTTLIQIGVAPSNDVKKRFLENNNGKRKGYMELMKDLWEDKGYALFALTAENLCDKAAQVQKSKKGIILEACPSNDIHEILSNYFENDNTNLIQNKIDQRWEDNNVNNEIESIAGACNTIDKVNNTDVPLLSDDPCIPNNFI